MSTAMTQLDDGSELDARGGVSVDGASYEFPGRVLWHDVTFSVASGQVLALRGQSGSGKTTLLQCVGSLERPTSGEITVAGARVGHLRGRQHRRFLRESVGFVFQNAGLVASWSVRKNLEISGARLSERRDGSALSSAAVDVFDQFALSPSLISTPVLRLSGGEQQRIALVRLALRRPTVLLLDEPSSALDDANTDRLLTFIDRHCRAGGSAVIATHDMRVIERADLEFSL